MNPSPISSPVTESAQAPRVLHVMDCLDDGIEAWVAMDMARFFNRNHGAESHRLLSLQKPASEGLRRAELLGVEVDSGSGLPFLTYHIQRSDIVHLHWCHTPSMEHFLSMDLGPRRLLLWNHRLGHQLPHCLSSRQMRQADVVVQTYQGGKEALLAHLSTPLGADGARCLEIPNSLQCGSFEGKPEKASSDFCLGIMGSILPHRLHPRVIAMHASEQIPECRVRFAGPGNPQFLQEQARLHNRAERFEFLGNPSHVESFFQQLDVFVCPVAETFDGTHDVFLQIAMLAGLPCIVFPHGGLKNMVVHQFSGLVVHSEEEYLKAITWLHDHPEERERLGNNARLVAQQTFGLEKTSDRIKALYDEMMASEKRPSPQSSSETHASGAEIYLTAMGSHGRVYQASRQSSSFSEAAHCDLKIQQMGSAAHVEGIQAYLRAYPNDPWLLFWSGLAYLGSGEASMALNDFSKAKDQGLLPERIDAAIIQAAIRLKRWDMASALLESLECLHPGSRELETLRQQLPAPRASDTQRVLEALPFSVFQETLENHLYRQDLASAQATVQSLEPWHLQDYQPEETHWVMDASLKLGMESWVLETTGFWMEKKSCPISILVAGAEAAWNRKDADLFAVITQRILKDQPDHAATYRMIGRWHIRNYQFGDAAQCLAQSLHHEPEDIPTLKRLAECFRVMGEAEGERLTREEIVRVRQSKPAAETSLTPETNPMDSEPNSLTSNLNVNMNQTLIKLQELVDAQNQASGATYLDSLSLEAVTRSQQFTAICELALKLKAFPWVLKCIQFVGQQGDLDIQTLRFCAEACVAADSLETLLELAPKVFAISPDDPLVCRLIASMYLTKENYLETAPWLARALKQEPDHLPSLEVLAECFEHCGESEARDHTLERIQTLQKEKQSLLLSDASSTKEMEPTASDTSCEDSDLSPVELLHAQDRLVQVQMALENQAFSWLRKVADQALVSTDCPLEILQACCKACVELDDEAMLLELAERAESQIPGDPITCRLVAGYHLKKDRYLSAAPLLARSLKHDPDHLMTLEVLAECFEHAGEHEAKEHTLQRIAEVQAAPPTDADSKTVDAIAPGQLMGRPDRSLLVQSALEQNQYPWLRSVAEEMIKTEGCPVEMLQACCKACVELEDEPMLLGLTSRIEEVVSNDPISCRLVAGHYLKKDDFLTAAPYLARSLKREPDHLVTLEILAECFERAGEVEARDHTLERIQAVQSPSQEAPVNSPEDIPSQVHEHAAESSSIEAAEDASTPLVTAFVSTYASENFMRGCLEDLLNQTLGKRLEIIVIDSGSPEREGDIVREYQKNHPNIRYIRTENRETIYEAWNRGVKAARGKYVVNANTDDGHRKDAFERLAQCLEANPGASIAYGDIVYSTQPNDTFPSEHVTRQIHYPDFHPGLAFACCFAGCTQFWRREDLIRIGCFDARYKAAGDYEMLLRAVQHGMTAVHVPEELSLHYFNEKGITFGPETKQLSVDEAQQARQDHVNRLDIAALYNQVDASSHRKADLWCDLADFFYQYKAPWEMENPKHGIENLNFVVYCVKKALEEEASHEVAASNLVWLDRHFGQGNEASAYLLSLGDAWDAPGVEKLMNECDQWKAVTLSDQSEVPVSEPQSQPVALDSQGDCQAPITGQQASIEQTSEVAKDVQGPPVCSSVGSLQESDQLYASGAYEKAWECTQEAILKRPFSPEGFFILGKIALIAGDLEKAKVCVDRLSDMTPDWPHTQQLADEWAASSACHPPRLTLSDLRCIGSGSRVSVCLIAKDEEAQIGLCLDSVASFAHEIILVDTGSTDQTVAIAEAKGARVIHHPWQDDFSDARNVSLEHATGDWILVLDADERLNVEDIPTLQRELKQSGILNYRLPIHNHGAKEYGHGYVPRLYRNAPGLCYIGRIHEQIYFTTEMLRKRWCMRGALGETPIQHYGYREEIVQAKDKRKRNLKLLERAVQETPDEANYRYNYALELRNAGRGQEALGHYQKAIDLLKTLPDEAQVPEFTHALVQQYGSVLLEEKGYEKVAEMADDPWIQRHVASASWSLVQGIAYAEGKEYEKALGALEDCIALRHKPVLSPGIIEVQSGLPAFLKGKIHHQLEQGEKASEAFALAVMDSPDNLDYLIDYAAWLHAHSKSLEAVQLLHRQMPHGAKDPRYWQLGAKISQATQGFESFYLDWTTEAIKYQPHDTELLFAHLESLMWSRQWGRAVHVSSEFPSEPKLAAQWGLHYLLCLYQGISPKRFNQVEEKEVSAYFMSSYRRLVQLGDEEGVRRIHEHLTLAKEHLPTATRLIEQVVEKVHQVPVA